MTHIADVGQSPFLYNFGGICLKSDVELNQLPVFESDGLGRTITVSASSDYGAGGVINPGTPVFAWKGRFGMSLHRKDAGWLFCSRMGIMFEVDSAGASITLLAGGPKWDRDAEEILVHRLLPRVVQLHDYHVLHASAVARDGKALLFCGLSGTGKSTLAAYLAQSRGWSLMCDDACVLALGDELPYVSTTCTGLSLFGDSVDGVRLARSGRTRKVAQGLKQMCIPAASSQTKTAVVAGILILGQCADGTTRDLVAIRSLTPAESVANIGTHLVRFNPVDLDARQRQLAFLGRLVGLAPVRLFNYPRRFESLSVVADAIMDAFGGGTSAHH